jgi:CRP-like cAMP-binding protein
MPVSDLLSTNPYLKTLFENFESTDLEKIKIAYFASDIPILTTYTSFQYTYILVNGICGMYSHLENGEEYCYYKIANYDSIGVSTVSKEKFTRDTTIKTHTKLVALEIDKNDLKEWIIKYPDFYQKLSNSTIARLHETLRKHVECKKYTSLANIVSYMIYSFDLYKKVYEKDHLGAVKINETRQMITDFLGISIRSVNNSIETLRKLNYLVVKHGKIYIDFEQYQKLIEYKEELLK